MIYWGKMVSATRKEFSRLRVALQSIQNTYIARFRIKRLHKYRILHEWPFHMKFIKRVNDVTGTRQNVITRRVIQFFMIRLYPQNNSDVI